MQRRVLKQMALAGTANAAAAVAAGSGSGSPISGGSSTAANAALAEAPLSLDEAITLVQRLYRAKLVARQDAVEVNWWFNALPPEVYVRQSVVPRARTPGTQTNNCRTTCLTE
jgi:hypothetical protein